MSDGYVKLSSKATWSKDDHPESLEQHPVLELRIEHREVTGTWDDENKQWIIEEGDRTP
ncbi:MAG: hypothetical protein ACRDL7_05935 [Gaiellaceae bacterium]